MAAEELPENQVAEAGSSVEERAGPVSLPEAPPKWRTGVCYEGLVTGVHDWGLNVELAPGVVAACYAYDLLKQPASQYCVGDKISVYLLCAESCGLVYAGEVPPPPGGPVQWFPIQAVPVKRAEVQAWPVQAEEPPYFGAKRAFLCLLLALLAQILAGFLFGLAGGIVAGITHTNHAEAINKIIGLAIIFGGLAMAGASWLAAKCWAGHLIGAPPPDGLGFNAPPRRAVLKWMAVGILLALLFVCVIVIYWAPRNPGLRGPIARLVGQGGAGRACWAIFAVLIAPLSEEFLFRGLLLKGFQKSWGLVPAACVVTAVFVAMHTSDIWRCWPAAFSIAAFGALVMWARIKTSSLWPGVAAHTAYNATLVATIYLLSFLR